MFKSTFVYKVYIKNESKYYKQILPRINMNTTNQVISTELIQNTLYAQKDQRVSVFFGKTQNKINFVSVTKTTKLDNTKQVVMSDFSKREIYDVKKILTGYKFDSVNTVFHPKTQNLAVTLEFEQ